MFYFWREATAALVPGFLCESGRRRPEIHLKFPIMLSLLSIEREQKNLQIHFQFAYLSYSFWIETINTFIHSHSSLENHTLSQTKMGKVYTRLQTKIA